MIGGLSLWLEIGRFLDRSPLELEIWGPDPFVPPPHMFTRARVRTVGGAGAALRVDLRQYQTTVDQVLLYHALGGPARGEILDRAIRAARHRLVIVEAQDGPAPLSAVHRDVFWAVGGAVIRDVEGAQDYAILVDHDADVPYRIPPMDRDLGVAGEPSDA